MTCSRASQQHWHQRLSLAFADIGVPAADAEPGHRARRGGGGGRHGSGGDPEQEAEAVGGGAADRFGAGHRRGAVQGAGHADRARRAVAAAAGRAGRRAAVHRRRQPPPTSARGVAPQLARCDAIFGHGSYIPGRCSRMTLPLRRGYSRGCMPPAAREALQTLHAPVMPGLVMRAVDHCVQSPHSMPTEGRTQMPSR